MTITPTDDSKQDWRAPILTALLVAEVDARRLIDDLRHTTGLVTAWKVGPTAVSPDIEAILRDQAKCEIRRRVHIDKSLHGGDRAEDKSAVDREWKEICDQQDAILARLRHIAITLYGEEAA